MRTHTAEALGTIGASAEEAAQALVEAMADDNDRVRAKAVEAWERSARARRPPPSRPDAGPPRSRQRRRALAAEALGQMGESADGAIPALVRR